MKGSEIRKRFLEYFKERGHTVLPSSPLVPRNDPTLLFTNAGMVQFKDIFTGEKPRAVPRAVTSQKCMRAGGKHNDLENVGRTARHLTFFEMLGNFSFGDYFKEEAIDLAWDFLVRELGLPQDRLWVSVFQDDDHAFRIWRDKVQVSADRVLRLGEESNFWAMGDTGPCGPCSEIYVDQGNDVGCGRPECSPGCDCDRFLEIWNLVFMQYIRDGSGTLTPLPKPSIDTGMGLERITAVLQGVKTNYDTDLFQGIISGICDLTGKAYGSGHESNTSTRVIADHIRALTFLIAEGTLPSNEGRGYVLRRILRRAARHGKLLGLNEPFLFRLAGIVVDEMKEAFPELVRARDHVAAVVLNEEERFLNTLDQGLSILVDLMQKLIQQGKTLIPGNEIFKLYDTYGFPLDLTQDIASEKGLSLDEAGFREEMERQRDRARASWKGSEEKGIDPLFKSLSETCKTAFVGYDRTESESGVLSLILEGALKESVQSEVEVDLMLDATPFYPESGGQTGDQGNLEWDGGSAEVLRTWKPAEGLIVHRARVLQGFLKTGQKVSCRVDPDKRKSTAHNHTATHILHAVLRHVLGDHVKQAGSLVETGRLRFDFTHFAPVHARELERIEQLANEWIWRNVPVETEVKPLNEAISGGATALFGEKYGSEVRVVSIPELSMELCGGTHVHATGEIGLFKIQHEGGIAAGVRRIEAVTGAQAYEYFKGLEGEIRSLSDMVKESPGRIAPKVEKTLKERKDLLQEIGSLKRELAELRGGDIIELIRDIDGVKVLSHRVDQLSPEELREHADRLRERVGSGVVVAGSENKGKVALIAMVSKDLTRRIHAGNLIKEGARITGGKGGGRPDMAQAGGTDASKLDDALNKVFDLVREQMTAAGKS
ncbi:MAG: alanine--tRNA ligase [bacterium]